jgi:hypothetical protein
MERAERFGYPTTDTLAAAAGLSNVYYSPADRTVGATMSRWGTQVMWDTVANELKEFWPDISAKLRRR